MANIIGLLTVNSTDIIEVDDLPMRGSGTVAELGDLALLQKNNASYLFQKCGNDNRAWTLISKSNIATTSGFNIDFLSNNPTGETGWVSAVSGGTVALSSVLTESIFGVTTLTANNGVNNNRASLRSYTGFNFAINNSFVTFKTYVRPTGTTSFVTKIGLGLLDTQTENTEHIIFKAISGTTNWIAESRSASITSSLNTGVAYTSGSWLALEMQIDGLNNEVRFFINKNFVGTLALGINKTSGLNFGHHVLKTSNGGGEYVLDVDSIFGEIIYNTPISI